MAARKPSKKVASKRPSKATHLQSGDPPIIVRGGGGGGTVRGAATVQPFVEVVIQGRVYRLDGVAIRTFGTRYFDYSSGTPTPAPPTSNDKWEVRFLV